MCSIRMTELHKAVSKTISVNIISSVFPGPIFSLTESGLFSLPEFDFDLGPRLQSSPPTIAHGPFLSLKPGVEPSLFVQTDQAKEFQQSHLFRARVNDNLWINCCYENQCEHLIVHPSWVNPSFHHRRKTWWMILDYFSPVPLVSRKKKGQGGRKLSWLPLGLYALERREELHFLNGRQYCLTSTICRNPYYTIKDAKSTQTDFSGASMCDVAMKRVDHRTIHP